MESRKTGNAPAHFNVGDLVRVKDLPNLFYSRTQMYVRGVRGTIAARTYEDLLPEDEAWNRDDAQPEQFYIVRFRQKDLWVGYPFENDTLQTELGRVRTQVQQDEAARREAALARQTAVEPADIFESQPVSAPGPGTAASAPRSPGRVAAWPPIL